MEQIIAAPNSVAPPVKTERVQLDFTDIRRAARCNVLADFAREQRYRHHVDQLRRSGEDIQVMKLTPEQNRELVRASATRLLKEHSSASWGVHLYQIGVYGLTGVSSVATAMGFYLGIFHNRMFLPIGPISGVIAWRMWNVVEEAWAQQRYIDNAARLREERKGNPMNAVVHRRLKTSEGTTEDVEGTAADAGAETSL